jgi:hypothetical protein
MFQPNSRYANLGTAQFTRSDGRIITYCKRRFLPPGDNVTLLAEVPVTQGDRPDLVAARVLRDPEQYWRICDTNKVMRPEELTETPGRLLQIALPQGQG